MKKKILIGSILAVVILILVSFNSVVGKVSSDEELVKLDVEFCGLGRKHTIQLTQQDADEVELLFDGIEHQLSQVETREEAEVIFKDAIVELDKYGLLGDLSVKQAQQLILGGYVRQNLLKGIDRIDRNTLDRTSANYFCLIEGQLSHMFSQNLLFRIFTIFMEKIYEFAHTLHLKNLEGLSVQILVIFGLIQSFFIAASEYLPQSFFRTLSAGKRVYDSIFPDVYYYPANGKVTSYGELGLKQWEGNLWGIASEYRIGCLRTSYYPAILGFTGIKLINRDRVTNFIGFALKADFSDERPYI